MYNCRFQNQIKQQCSGLQINPGIGTPTSGQEFYTCRKTKVCEAGQVGALEEAKELHTVGMHCSTFGILHHCHTAEPPPPPPSLITFQPCAPPPHSSHSNLVPHLPPPHSSHSNLVPHPLTLTHHTPTLFPSHFRLPPPRCVPPWLWSGEWKEGSRQVLPGVMYAGTVPFLPPPGEHVL